MCIRVQVAASRAYHPRPDGNAGEETVKGQANTMSDGLVEDIEANQKSEDVDDRSDGDALGAGGGLG